MTDSANEARVLVLCKNRDMRIDRVRELYQNQIEFNYLPERDLDKCTVKDGSLTIGANTYEYVYCDDNDRVDGVTKIHGIRDLTYRDLYTEVPCPDLRVSRIKKSGMRMLFITNEGETKIKSAASIDGESTLVAMDLWTGEHWRESSERKDGKTSFNLDLPPRESLLLILDSNGTFDAPKKASRKYVTVDFDLVSEDTELFVKTYEGKLDYDGTGSDEIWISVTGEEMVECFVNSIFVDFSLLNAHKFNITRHLSAGENTVMLKFTGNAANRFTDHRIKYGLL